MTDTAVKLTLFIVGNSRNSRVARDTLQRLLDGLPDRRHISLETVDILDDPGRPLREGILITPALKLERGGQEQIFIGNLSRAEDLLGTLRSAEDAITAGKGGT